MTEHKLCDECELRAGDVIRMKSFKSGEFAENKRVLDALKTNPTLNLYCEKCRNTDVAYLITESKLASLRLKEDEKK